MLLFQKRRRRIDRSMIGEPTNFVHTTHVGSGDMGLGLASVGFGFLLKLWRHVAVWSFQSVNMDFSTFTGGSRSGPNEIQRRLYARRVRRFSVVTRWEMLSCFHLFVELTLSHMISLPTLLSTSSNNFFMQIVILFMRTPIFKDNLVLRVKLVSNNDKKQPGVVLSAALLINTDKQPAVCERIISQKIKLFLCVTCCHEDDTLCYYWERTNVLKRAFSS